MDDKVEEKISTNNVQIDLVQTHTLQMGMVETDRAFKMELIVLSSGYERQLPKHIEWLIHGLNLWKSNVKVNELSSKRKNESDDGSSNENIAKRIQKLISPQIVQIKATNLEIEQRIDMFVQLKKSEINNSNRAEFLRKSSNPNDPDDVISCARTDAAEINRNIQMKHDVVNNDDGPLARSTFLSSNQRNDKTKELPTGVEERIQNIEKHLNLKIDVYTRIKILEDKIIQLERDYPPWAAVHFNQPNRQFPPPSPVTEITLNSIGEIIGNTGTTLPSGNKTLSNSTPTSTYHLNSNSMVEGKQMSPISPVQIQQNLKFSRTPRPIKPKSRGRGDSSMTRSIMEQLKQRRRIESEQINNITSKAVGNCPVEKKVEDILLRTSNVSLQENHQKHSSIQSKMTEITEIQNDVLNASSLNSQQDVTSNIQSQEVISIRDDRKIDPGSKSESDTDFIVSNRESMNVDNSLEINKIDNLNVDMIL
ncbi:11921_t:CDS:2 [Diversispora eburnea]|uniref:11921_t:CDS:1 n=1 Tax=Diversispora eburnea TaxID=1213867 RepID=A0A9N8V3E0_9GLOM|nr:11921_t:CDS:2 [Diversispora eburnea]